MAVIPQNVIFIWTGTHAGIPSGYTRETSLDGRFAKATANGVNPNVTGGNATHTHSATATHSHIMDSHTHSITLNTTTDYWGRAGGTQVWQEHTHSAHNSGSASGGALSSVSSTYASFSNDPPYYEVIFIKSNGTTGVPDQAVALYDYVSGSLPANWYSCDGNNSTPNLSDKYLKGASTAQNAGTTGGSLTNIHTLTHTHTVATHTHDAATSTSASPAKPYDGWGGAPTGGHGSSQTTTHTHSTSLDAQTATLTGSVSLTTAESVEPVYKKLMAIQNRSGSAEAPYGVIGLWLGTLASIPAGWSLCDGTRQTIDMRTYHLKIGSSAQVGSTGGSNTHTHASQTHAHTGVAHNHSATSSQHPAYTDFGYSGYYTSATGIKNTTVHPASVANATATYADGSTAGDSQDNEPLFTTVAFIKQTGYANTATADILRANETQANSVKSQIVYKMAQDSSTKANLIHTTPVDLNVRANIRKAFSHKTYEYRVYDGSSYVTTWSSEVLSLPSFTATINGGVGQMSVKLARSYDSFGEDVDIKLSNKVDCYCFDLEAPMGQLLYSGYISAYRPVIDRDSEYVDVTLLPYIAEMQHVMLRSGAGDTTITESSKDPAQIFKDIINYYRADGGSINYTASSIDDTGTTVSYTFKTYTVKEALDKALELTPEHWYWFVTPDNTLYLKETGLTTADHDLVSGKHLISLETLRRAEDLVNRVYFVGAESAGVAMFRQYSNTASITAYGIHAKKIVDQRVSLTSTADIIANKEINEKKDPEIRTTAVILDSNGPDIKHGYDIESIRPGQSIRLKNLKQGVKTVSLWDQARWDEDVWDQTLSYQAADIIQIQSVEYHPDYLVIETASRLPEVPKRIEDIYRNLEETQSNNTPSSPTVV